MENLRQILELIFKEKEEDNKKQKAFGKIFDIIAPDTHRPYIEISVAEKLIKLIKLINSDLASEIEYFLYEAPNFYRRDGCRFLDEKTQEEILIKNDKDAIEYLLRSYGNENT